MDDIFSGLNDGIYIEKDLFLIKNPTGSELNKMLKEAMLQAKRFEFITDEIRAEVKKIKEKIKVGASNKIAKNARK